MASNNFDIGSLPVRNPSSARKVSFETPFVNKSDMLYLVFTYSTVKSHPEEKVDYGHSEGFLILN